MFRNAIKHLQKNPSQVVYEDTSFCFFDNGKRIIKIPSGVFSLDKDRKNESSFYYFNSAKQSTNKLDEGTFGTVYKAEQLNSDGNFHTNSSKSLAVKVFKFSEQEEQKVTKVQIEKEVEFFQKISPALLLQGHDGQLYMIMEYLGQSLWENGKHRFAYEGGPGAIISKLTLLERLKAIVELFSQLTIIHSAKAGSPGIIHGDIKPENIIFEVRDGKIIKIQFIDFGLSIPVNDWNLIERKTGGGTLEFLAPETFKGKIGVKSDIYSMVPVVLLLLGTPTPLQLKNLEHQNAQYLGKDEYYLYKKLTETKYCFKGLFSGLEEDLKITGGLLQPLINVFIQRMQDSYKNRPDAYECLNFFNKVYLLIRKIQKEPNKRVDDFYEDFFHLRLLAVGLPCNLSLPTTSITYLKKRISNLFTICDENLKLDYIYHALDSSTELGKHALDPSTELGKAIPISMSSFSSLFVQIPENGVLTGSNDIMQFLQNAKKEIMEKKNEAKETTTFSASQRI